MNYSNLKQSFRKLFIAEMLMIIANIVGGLDEKITWISFVAVGLMIVAFVMNLNGLKEMAKENAGYKTAYTCTIIGIVITVISAILSAIFQDNTAGKIATDICKDVSKVAEFMTAYYVMKTSVDVLKGMNRNDLAEETNKTLNLYSTTYCISIILELFTDVKPDLFGAIFIIVAIVTVVAALVAQIKYYIFLKKMSDAL